MIWGRTTKEKVVRKVQPGDTRIRFIWIPEKIESGRWVWWEYVRQEWTNVNYCYWKNMEVVASPIDLAIYDKTEIWKMLVLYFEQRVVGNGH